jgi:hypothetical protein
MAKVCRWHYVLAYMWSNLAEAQGYEDAQSNKDIAESRMTREQIALRPNGCPASGSRRIPPAATSPRAPLSGTQPHQLSSSVLRVLSCGPEWGGAESRKALLDKVDDHPRGVGWE